MTTTEYHAKRSPMLRFGFMVAAILFISACYFIWQAWPSIIITSLKWQKAINNQLSELLFEAKNHSLIAGFTLTGLSFLYGMLHSLGPGHGKLIVSTYIATHPAKVKTSLILTLVSAIMQAVVAVTLVSALLLLFNSSMRGVNSKAELFISLSFYLVILLGIGIVCRNMITVWRVTNQRRQSIAKTSAPSRISAIRTITTAPGLIPSSAQNTSNSATIFDAEEGSKNCACGHRHFAGAAQINAASSIKEYLAIILSIGIRPCTGAIMVLLFANMIDVYWLGIISAFVMALGTALTTSLIAIMTITGRQLVRRYLNTRSKSANTPQLGGTLLQLTGGLLLILMGVILLGSQPVGISPIF